MQENFRKYAVDSWASGTWRVIDEGSKQGTRRAWARLRVGKGLWFLVVDNRADDYDVLPAGPPTGPALLHLSFNTSGATIRVPAQSDAGQYRTGGELQESSSRTVGPAKTAPHDLVTYHRSALRSAPVLRWSLLLFFAALPGTFHPPCAARFWPCC